MKPTTFRRPGISIEAVRSISGRYYVCWKPNVSALCGDRKAVLRFAAWPAKTPTGDELRTWLAELEAADSVKAAPLSDKQEEIQATGFGPECHLDESDPNFATRTVI